MSKRSLLVIALGIAAIALASGALILHTRAPEDAAISTPPHTADARPLEGPQRALVIAGAMDATGISWSLHEEAQALLAWLPSPHAFLSADGAATWVQATTSDAEGPLDPAAALRERLGALFQPRDRALRFSPITPEASAAPAQLYDAIHALSREGDAPLDLFFLGHGEAGEWPMDAAFLSWGGAFTVADLDEASRDAGRPVRVWMGSCFSGGFADFIFEGANPARPLAQEPRCGLFAATWDSEASGCDPDPARGREGYSSHFIAALTSAEVEGIDADGDGAVSWMEAHTVARIESRSIDVPWSSSERYLELQAAALSEAEAEEALSATEAATDATPEMSASARAWLREEDAVIAALSAELSLPQDAEAAHEALAEKQAELLDLESAIEDTRLRFDDAFWALQTALLRRWPLLDDPFHRDWEATFSAHQDEIAQVLDTSEAGRAFAIMDAALGARLSELDALDQQIARLQTLVGAHLAIERAGQIARDPEAFAAFTRLRECERSAP